MMGDLTPRAQQALALSKRVAVEMESTYVGTEHLLVGIITLGQGVAVNALLRRGVDFVSVRAEVEKESAKNNTTRFTSLLTYAAPAVRVLLPPHQQRVLLHARPAQAAVLLRGVLQPDPHRLGELG